jgi:superfamily I DNA/RNA helicase
MTERYSIHLNAATGLESPVVILVGMNSLYELEQNLSLTVEEKEELIRDNTRRLYMAMTRAGQRLFFIAIGSPPDSLKLLFAQDLGGG